MKISHFDIIFNEYLNFGDASVNSQIYDLESTATHEFGHTFGLNDLYNSPCSQETMYGVGDKGEIFARTLNDGDIAGLNIIYPTQKRVLTTITVIPATSSVTAGSTQTFNTSIKDQFGEIISATITWGSSNTTVGTITSSGLFTAIKTGTTTIIAASDSVSGNATLTVIPGAIASIMVMPSAAIIPVGHTQNFTASGYDANYNAVGIIPNWSSSNNTVGNVSESGLFTAIKVGSAIISASYNGIAGIENITVTPGNLSSIIVSLSNSLIIEGQTQNLTANGYDANGNDVGIIPEWSSSNTTVGTMTSSGVFTAVAAGLTNITATNGSIVSNSTILTVTPMPVLTTITISSATATFIIGNSTTFNATKLDQFGNPINASVTWNSSNTTVGNVNQEGLFTALANGTTILTATAGEISGRITVRVGINLVDTYLPPTATPAERKAGLIRAMDDYFDNGALTKVELLSVLDAYFA
jgi:hypothetical protein